MSLAQIVEACKFLLKNAPQALETREYLNSRLSPEIQEYFSFGYFPETSHLGLLIDLIGEDVLQENKLLYTRNVCHAADAQSFYISFFASQPLIMPYQDLYGNVVALVARSLLPEEIRREEKIEKYKNTSFKKGNHLFGLDKARLDILNKDYVYVVEGQFDVIKAVEKGIKNIVALGNSNITDYQMSILSRYTKNIHLLLDNDTAGDKGRVLAQNNFRNLVKIKNGYLPMGYKDLDEYLQENSGDSLEFALKYR